MNSFEVASVLRTARHLIGYLGEIKSSAAQLATQLDAVEKGYFSPTQDEQAQALLVSYWHVRAALLELIRDLQLHLPAADPERSVCFVAGFGAALSLVDAARFLRTEVEGRPVVREKLNQAIPEFGIKAGTYDAVQRSLIGGRRAWQLFQANRLFQTQRAPLRKICTDLDVVDVFDYVDQRRHLVDVGLARFAQVRWSTRAAQMVAALRRNTLARAMYGMQKWGGDALAGVFVRPGHQPHLPDRVIHQLDEVIQPGDVLVVRKEYAVTNYFLPGYWPHAALYLGRPAQLTDRGVRDCEAVATRWASIERAAKHSGHCVLEAMKDGVLLRSWSSPLASDSLVLLRPQLDDNTIDQALQRVMDHEGKNYDYDFDFARSDRLVCTEVVYRAYEGLGAMSFELQRRAGRLTLSGYDIVGMGRDGNCFDVAAAFLPDASSDLLLADRANALVARVLAR